jgi:hypothetical protein
VSTKTKKPISVMFAVGHSRGDEDGDLRGTDGQV